MTDVVLCFIALWLIHAQHETIIQIFCSFDRWTDEI